jgi:hypothetical protein
MTEMERRSDRTVATAVPLALAEALDLTLLSAELRVARASGIRCHVETLN